MRSTVAGMAGNVAPDLLKEAQVARMLNCTSRGGHAATRPRLVTHPVSIPRGLFQGAAVYRRQGVDRIVYCVNGEVRCINLETGAQTHVASFPTREFDLAYFCQVDQYFVVQNGIYSPYENWPIILDGDLLFDNLDATYYDSGTSSFKRVGDSPNPELYRIPIGTAMAYGQGRLFTAVERFRTSLSGGYVTGNGVRYIIAGDILQPDNVTGVLASEEYVTGTAGNAQVIGLPWEIGFITALGFFRNSFTGTGLGPLVAVCREGSAAFSVDLARTDWIDSDTGSFSKVLFYGSGSDSPSALIPVNDDLVYRGRDGLRTIKYTQAAEASSSGSLSNVPYSSEVDEFFLRDTREYSLWASMAYVDNRVLTTAGGATILDSIGTGFDTLISLDTSVLNSIYSSRPARAYDGIWTGPLFLSVLSARYADKDRAFVFCYRRDTQKFSLAYFDTVVADDFSEFAPVSRVYTADYEFGDFVRAKEFVWADLWFTEMAGDVDVTLYWRPDGVSVWHPCRSRSFSFCSGSLDGTAVQVRLQPHETNGIGCDQATKVGIRLGTTFQFCVEWTGKAKLVRGIFAVKPMTDRVGEVSCAAPTECVTVAATSKDLVLNDFTIYQV